MGQNYRCNFWYISLFPFFAFENENKLDRFLKSCHFQFDTVIILYSVAFVYLRSAYTTDMSGPIVEEHHFPNKSVICTNG